MSLLWYVIYPESILCIICCKVYAVIDLSICISMHIICLFLSCGQCNEVSHRGVVAGWQDGRADGRKRQGLQEGQGLRTRQGLQKGQGLLKREGLR